MKIEVQALKKSYFLGGHEVPVLRGIDFTLASGEMATLTGTSGVGKSTLLHLLGTLDTPSGGKVFLDGHDVFADAPAEMARFRNQNIGFVFQFHHLLPEFSALENVMMPLLIRRESEAVATRAAREWLSLVGLAERTAHKPGELSGGEQQRVALARALVGNPRLLLADEPTGNLDENTGAGIFEVMQQLNRERGITVLLVTHNPRLASLSSRRLTLTRDEIK